MRVTDLTKQNSVVRSVQNNAAELQNLQETMASGRRINKLSDDPLGAAQTQDFRTKISYFKNLQQIIQQSYLWLDRSEAELEHMAEQVRQVKSLVLSQANDSSDASSRMVTAEEVKNIIEGLVQAGNARLGKVYIFGGSKTLTPPLQRNVSNHPAIVRGENLDSDLKFLMDLDAYAAEFSGFSQNPYIVRITQEGPIGRAHYSVSDDGGETWSIEKTLLPDIEVLNEQGKPSEKILMSLPLEEVTDLGNMLVYPKGLEFEFRPNPALAYVGNDDKRKIPTSEGALKAINVTAKEIFFADPERENTLDILDMMFSIESALLANDQSTLSDRVDDLDRAFEQVLNLRADLGSVRRELDEQNSKLVDREFNGAKQMSELEDLDFPKAVLEMNTADVKNRASLNTSGRLLQPSLLNFLK